MRTRPLIDYGRMLDLLGSEGRLLLSAVREAHPDAQVAGVSGRTVEGTVRHLNELCEDALGWLGSSEPLGGDRHLLPGTARSRSSRSGTDTRQPTGCFAARLTDLLAEFGTRSPDQPCPTWCPDEHTVGFWLRRMVHATTVHRVDVQTATGAAVTPVEADLAGDGVDEALRVWFGYRLGALGMTTSRRWSVRVVVNERHWVASGDPCHTAAARARASGTGGEDGIVNGDPSATYLWLWGRVPDRSVRATGDPDAIAQLWCLMRMATQ